MNADTTPPPPPLNPSYSQPPSAGGEARTSPQAVWSLILGILSILCLWFVGSIPAIILGFIAIGKINASSGALKGKGMAIGGIVTAVIGLISGSCVTYAVWQGMKGGTGIFASMGEGAGVGALTAGIIQYHDQTGEYPSSIEDVENAGGIMIAKGSLKKAEASGRVLTFYHYDFTLDNLPAGLTKSDVPLVSLPGGDLTSGQIIYGLADGQTEVKPAAAFQAILDGVSQYRTN